MKRTLLSISIMFFAITLLGQNSFSKCYPIDDNRSIKSEKFNNSSRIANQNGYGDVIWSEDFGGGAIPAGWNTVDNNGSNWIFYWSDDVQPGTQGTYSAYNDTFMATTASNGYIMISGDIYNVGGGTTLMDSYFVTAPINCDTASSVLLQFEQYFRFCCNTSTSQISLIVSVSNDNVNWVDFDVLNGVEVNDYSENPDVVTLNISQVAAGESTVYIKFHKYGVSHYFWAIDDILLTNMPENDVKLNQTYISNVGLFSGSLGYLGYYSSVPTNQITPVSFMGDIYNFGINTQHNVAFNAIITDANGVEVYNQSGVESTILSDSMPFVEIPNYFNATSDGEYTVSMSVNQNETDELPADNIQPDINFGVNSNKVYARDIGVDSRTGVSYYSGGGDGDFMGLNYYITAPDTIESLSVYISDITDVNTILIAALFKKVNGDRIYVLGSEEYIIQPADLGEWITIPFLSMSTTDNVLEPQTEYVAGFEFYSGGGTIAIGSDTQGPHIYSLATALRLGQTWYYISVLPAVRLNLIGADVLPFITSAPEYEVDYSNTFEYTVNTYDPQGLPVTLTAITGQTDINMQATDNGDGTMTILIDPISTSSFIGEQFNISVTVDNGIATNNQQFWVQIINIIGVEELNDAELLIYPNPVKDILYCNNQANSNVQIYSVYGELLYSNYNSEANISIEMTDFNAGTYFIRIINDNKVINNKFIHVK